MLLMDKLKFGGTGMKPTACSDLDANLPNEIAFNVVDKTSETNAKDELLMATILGENAQMDSDFFDEMDFECLPTSQHASTSASSSFLSPFTTLSNTPTPSLAASSSSTSTATLIPLIPTQMMVTGTTATVTSAANVWSSYSASMLRQPKSKPLNVRKVTKQEPHEEMKSQLYQLKIDHEKRSIRFEWKRFRSQTTKNACVLSY